MTTDNPTSSTYVQLYTFYYYVSKFDSTINKPEKHKRTTFLKYGLTLNFH